MTTLNSKLQLALIKNKKTKNALQKGFTLVELLIVVVILGVLSAVALPNFLNQADKARLSAANAEAKAAANACAAALVTGEQSTVAHTNPAAAQLTTATTGPVTCADGAIYASNVDSLTKQAEWKVTGTAVSQETEAS
jgi:type IV pilus assembly protein PilA